MDSQSESSVGRLLQQRRIDTVISSGSAVLSGNIERLTLTGSVGVNGTGNNLANLIVGNSGANVLRGGGGDDIIRGGGGVDTIMGGGGNDTINTGAPYDSLYGGEGIDTVIINSGMAMNIDLHTGYYCKLLNKETPHYALVSFENVSGSRFDDQISGTFGNNLIEGNAGNDYFSGLFGSDTFDGGAGNDTMYGHGDADVMIGGEGADVFRFGQSFGAGNIVEDFHPSEGDMVSINYWWVAFLMGEDWSIDNYFLDYVQDQADGIIMRMYGGDSVLLRNFHDIDLLRDNIFID